MKGNEFHNMTDVELAEKLKERHASGQLENPVSIRTCKRNIARVNTEIRARELKAKA